MRVRGLSVHAEATAAEIIHTKFVFSERYSQAPQGRLTEMGRLKELPRRTEGPLVDFGDGTERDSQ